MPTINAKQSFENIHISHTKMHKYFYPTFTPNKHFQLDIRWQHITKQNNETLSILH